MAESLALQGSIFQNFHESFHIAVQQSDWDHKTWKAESLILRGLVSKNFHESFHIAVGRLLSAIYSDPK